MDLPSRVGGGTKEDERSDDGDIQAGPTGGRLAATGARRKKPSNRVERAFAAVRQPVSDTGDRLVSRSGQAKAEARPVSVNKTAAARTCGGRERRAVAKKVGATRIRGGRQREAEAKKEARARGAKTS
jgi:hypothetical protein